MRRDAKVDSNQPEIVAALRKVGCCVGLVLSMRSGGPNKGILIRSDSIFTENIFWIVFPMRIDQAELPEFYTSTLPKPKRKRKPAAKKPAVRKSRARELSVSA